MDSSSIDVVLVVELGVNTVVVNVGTFDGAFPARRH